MPLLGGSHQNIAITFGVENQNVDSKKFFEDVFIRFDIIHECDGRTNRQMDNARRHRPRL